MKNILVVDDVMVNRMLVKKILLNALEDINILEAEDGFKAMKIIAQNDISVVILDVMMPDKDGIEVLEEIKTSPKYKNISVIMCSAIHDIEKVKKALSLGAMDYFTKPLTQEQIAIRLPLKVRNALESYQQKRELIQFYEHIKEEMQLAEELQKSMIAEYLNFESITMYGKYIPCEDIGGDFYICKQLQGKVWFMIADIVGHGIAAAMISTMLNVIFSRSIQIHKTPGAVLENINDVLFEVFNGSRYGIISAFVGCINEDTLAYSNAGHPYPILYRETLESVEEISINGFLLGMFENIKYETLNTRIGSGDTVVLYTDGIIGKENEYVNCESVHTFCIKHKQYFADNIQALIKEMIPFFQNQNGGKYIDDVAVMIIKKT